MSVRDGRTAPFVWVSVAAMKHLRVNWVYERDGVKGVKAGLGRSVYWALCELANDDIARSRMHEDSDQFKASITEISKRAETSERSVERACAELTRIGLLTIEADRDDQRRQGRSSFYTLLEPGQTSVTSSDVDEPNAAKRPSPVRTPSATTTDVEADPPNPVRTPPSKEKKNSKEAEECEAPTAESDFGILPSVIAAPLRQVAEAKGGSFEPHSVKRACDAWPDRDHAVEAEAFAAWHLSGNGKNAPMRVAGVAFKKWLANGTPVESGKVTKLQAVPAFDREKIAEGLPHLAEYWPAIADRLRASVPESTFRLWVEPLAPIGMVEDKVYLTGPEGIRAWAERRYSSLIAAAAEGALGEKVAILFLPEDDAEAAA